MKNEISRIIVTDSGLGGLSVAAKIENELSSLNLSGNYEIIFCNALPDKNSGYNKLKSTDEKIRIFSSALTGMDKMFNPDLIVIACNTLSVIYPETEFCKNNKTKVIGIVEPGIEILLQKLSTEKNSAAIILGTETTTNSNVHKSILTNKGISPDKIFNQPCKFLESEIQINPEGEIVKDLIFEYVTNSIKNTKEKYEKMLFALCCTHYQYSKKIFERIINQLTEIPFEIIDPNLFLVEQVVAEYSEMVKPFADKGKVETKVVSRFDITADEIKIIGAQIKSESPQFANSLKNFESNKNLFEPPKL